MRSIGRTCAGRAGVIAVGFGLGGLVAPAASHGTEYTFIAVPPPTGYTDLENPVMNDAGQVAFAARREDEYERGVFRFEPGGAVTTVASTVGTKFFDFGFASINNAGDVAFLGRDLPTPYTGRDQIYVGSGGPLTVYAASGSGMYESAIADNDPVARGTSINNAGSVAFFNYAVSTGNGVYDGPSPVGSAIATRSQGYTARPSFDYNDAGEIAFHHVASGGPGPTPGIYKGTRGNLAALVTTSPGGFSEIESGSFFNPASLALNNRGQVAFIATVDGGRSGVFRGPNPSADRVASAGDADGEFGAFSAAAINDAGVVVLRAELNNGAAGLYTGANPATDKIVAVNDTLGGRTITEIEMDPRGALNTFGQIAFRYGYEADGETRYGYAIAAPVTSAKTIGTGGAAWQDLDPRAPGDVTVTAPAGGGTVQGPTIDTVVGDLNVGTEGGGPTKLTFQPGVNLYARGLTVAPNSSIGGVSGLGQIMIGGPVKVKGGLGGDITYTLPVVIDKPSVVVEGYLFGSPRLIQVPPPKPKQFNSWDAPTIALVPKSTLSPGNSAGTVTVQGNGVTFAEGVRLEFEFADPAVIGGNVNDLLAILGPAGNLMLDGTLDVFALDGFRTGTYTFMTYGGALIDNGLAIGAVPAGFSATVDTSVPGAVRLVVVPEPASISVALAACALLLRRRPRWDSRTPASH